MKKAILVAIIGAMTLGVNAGDWGKAPVIDKTPIEECYDVGGSLSAGYETDYIFKGVRYGRDSVWVDANYTFDSLWAPITIGTWYLDTPFRSAKSGAVSELDLYMSIDTGNYFGIDTSIGYTYYFQNTPFKPDGDYGELNLGLSYGLGFADLVWSSDYGFASSGQAALTRVGRGWFHQLGLERSFGITDNVSLALAAGIGYSDGYNNGLRNSSLGVAVGNTRSSGWNHYYVTASLPVELNCRATLTPYIGYNGAPDTWVVDGYPGGGLPGQQSDVLHGGVSLSVSF